MYKPNDRIKLCLKFVPVECRSSKSYYQDVRGEIYSITNERTRKTHYGRYGKSLESLSSHALKVKSKVERIPGVSDLRSSFLELPLDAFGHCTLL